MEKKENLCTYAIYQKFTPKNYILFFFGDINKYVDLWSHSFKVFSYINFNIQSVRRIFITIYVFMKQRT